MAIRIGQYSKTQNGRAPEDALADLLDKDSKDGVLKIGAPGPFAELAQVRRAALKVIAASEHPDRVYNATAKVLRGLEPREWGVGPAGAAKRVEMTLAQLESASKARAMMLEVRRELKGPEP